MTRKILLLGTITAFGLAAATVGAGDTFACDKATKSAAAATSAGCTKDTHATAASTKTAAAGCCAKDGAKATTAGNVHKSMIKSAVVAPGASPALNTAAFAAGVSGSTMTAGGASCCQAKSAGAAASSGKACDEAKAIRAGVSGKSCDAAVKTAGAAGSCEKTTSLTTAAVDVVPYREDKRLVLTGSYECGHCGIGATAECSPMFKTVDGKVYPLWNSDRVASLRQDNDKSVEIATVVKKVDGVKYLDVKSFKAL
jgi:hypothetical protein